MRMLACWFIVLKTKSLKITSDKDVVGAKYVIPAEYMLYHPSDRGMPEVPFDTKVTYDCDGVQAEKILKVFLHTVLGS